MPRCNNATPQCKFTTTRCIDTMTRCMFTTPHCNDATAQCMFTTGRCKNATPRCTITTGHCIVTSPKKSLQRLVVNLHCLIVNGQFPVREESYSRVNWPFGSAQDTRTAREASLRQRLNVPPFPCILWSKTMSCGRLKMFSLLENSRGIL